MLRTSKTFECFRVLCCQQTCSSNLIQWVSKPCHGDLTPNHKCKTHQKTPRVDRQFGPAMDFVNSFLECPNHIRNSSLGTSVIRPNDFIIVLTQFLCCKTFPNQIHNDKYTSEQLRTRGCCVLACVVVGLEKFGFS